MAEDLTSRLLGEQRKRLIASVMGAAENSHWWGKLSPAEQRAFRDKMLLSIGIFYDFCRDLVKVSNDDGMRNDYAVDLLNQVHAGQQNLLRAFNGRP